MNKSEQVFNKRNIPKYIFSHDKYQLNNENKLRKSVTNLEEKKLDTPKIT